VGEKIYNYVIANGAFALASRREAK